MITKHIATIDKWIINGICFSQGDIYYFNERRQFHREDGPALIGIHENLKMWYLNGQKHRIDGPAIEYRDGSEEWYFEGKYHRDGGPAVSHNSGLRQWFQHGKLHREDGPAEYTAYYKKFYLEDVQVEDASPSIWVLIKANPENIIYFGHTSEAMQEFVIQKRPDLINQIQDLKESLRIKYKNELCLGEIAI